MEETQAVVKGMYTIEGNVPLSVVVDILCDSANRPKWDTGMLKSDIVRRDDPHLLVYNYAVYMPIISNRDFVEKRIVFQEGEFVYFYYSSVDDSISPPTSDYTRGCTIFAVSRMRKLGERIVVETCTQKDIKATLSSWISISRVGKSMAESVTKFRDQLIGRINEVMFQRMQQTRTSFPS